MRPALLIALATVACAPQWKLVPHDTLFQRAVDRPIREPDPREPSSDWWEAGLKAGVRPLGQALSPSTYVDAVFGARPALDVNDFGEVPASTWFEPRIGRDVLTPADVFSGQHEHPPPAGPTFTVIAGKRSGTTPGFVVRDQAGVEWFVKFDPASFPLLSTAAEMVANRALDAAGYFVPETHLVEMDLGKLRIAEDATTYDEYNRSVPLNEERLSEFFILLNPDNANRTRALFSRRVEGKHLGGFNWRGAASDDRNDRIPHERRRSLRALRVLFAWLNNTDVKVSNTLDTFVRTDGERGVVYHYLQDLGDSLGAAGHRAKYRHEGYEPWFDWRESGIRLLALGARYPYWIGLPPIESRTLGAFEAEIYDPARWSPKVPNPAFDEATPEDVFWGGQLLARFTPELVGAMVDAADYQDPEIRDTVVERLLIRRAKTLAWAFEGYTALDRPRVVDGALVLTDLHVLGGLARESRFEVRVLWRDEVLHSASVEQPRVPLRELLGEARARSGFADDPFLTVSFRLGERGATRVFLRVTDACAFPVGLERDRT